MRMTSISITGPNRWSKVSGQGVVDNRASRSPSPLSDYNETPARSDFSAPLEAVTPYRIFIHHVSSLLSLGA